MRPAYDRTAATGARETSSRRRPRLRRGVYVFGLNPGVWNWNTRLADFARVAPAEMFSVLVSIEAEPETSLGT